MDFHTSAAASVRESIHMSCALDDLVAKAQIPQNYA